jgi:beta-glucosidase
MRRVKSMVVAIMVLLASAVALAAPPTKAEVDKRAEAILSKMTLEEKIDYIGGLNDFYVRAIPRLNVPELKMADGPMGVRNYGDSTAFIAGISMAASWDRQLVNRVGTMMGKDARARGVHFLLGPGMNIYRSPLCGRNFEYFGEDPFLAGQMAAADVKGIQSQGVSATAKHFAGNNQEWDRNHVSSDMDERTLHEIYLPAFEAAVKQGHVGAIMDAYNLVNGVHMTQQNHLNNEIVKRQWGFDGIIMSDWDATYDAVGAADGGLDLEMPSGKFMNRASLLPAVKDGRVSVATIDEKVRRILRKAIEFGWFDRDQTIKSLPLDNPESRHVAMEAALGGMVLLKNENNLLPLDKSKLRTIAVVGPNAGIGITGGGGSSQVHPFSSVSFLEGIQKYVGKSVKVVYAPGQPVATEKFASTIFHTEPSGGEVGMKGEYFSNIKLEGPPVLTRVDKRINFVFDDKGYGPGSDGFRFSVRWTGYYTPDTSSEYQFYVSGDDGYRLWVDDQPMMDLWEDHADTLTVASLKLEAGRAYKIRLEFYQNLGGANIGLGISNSANSATRLAMDAAAKADAVILCVGFTANTEGEGSDRTYQLPSGQEELVRQVIAANKNTVLVVTGGGSMKTDGWIAKLPAFIHAWYPGQEGGTALAKILFGEVSPSGKLPISFERRLEDSATFNSYHDPDKTLHVAYKEGVFLGYRHFDRSSTKPLFPFGFGLSYTTFKYSNLKVTPSWTGDTPVSVSFDITNTGKHEGAEVAEVYVSDRHAKVERPVKELKGFEKVNLKPGETKHVTVQLDRRAFEYYDVKGSRWHADPGEFSILVGASSQDIKLEAKTTLNP